MSLYKTTAPIDIHAFIAVLIRQLPEGSTMTSFAISEDLKSVEIVWSNPKMITGYTYPVDYPLEKLSPPTPPPEPPTAESTETPTPELTPEIDEAKKTVDKLKKKPRVNDNV